MQPTEGYNRADPFKGIDPFKGQAKLSVPKKSFGISIVRLYMLAQKIDWIRIPTQFVCSFKVIELYSI